MARLRREKTLADYVVIAISPVLIMTLVGSLAFFLVELSYRGQYEARLKWILFCYVSGSVLVARIAIEQGTEHASLFGLALGGVVGFAAWRLVDEVFVAWIILLVIWWCTWKLTWDCTLIDDNEDASGEGLLQASGLGDARTPEDQEPEREPAPEPPAPSGPAGWQHDFASLDQRPLIEQPVRRGRPHAPGRWIVYFSLAALPLFGVGQLLIPVANSAGRAYGFQLLALYVASALGLLLTTSFLGLRRYLRQRKLQMPAAMTGTWIGMGTALAIGLLLLALLIPRPQGGEYTLTALIDKVDAKVREASRLAVIRGDRGAGEGRRVGQQDQKAGKPGEGAARAPNGDDQKAAGDHKPAENRAAQADGQAKGDARPGKKGEGGDKPEGKDAAKQEQAAGQAKADRPNGGDAQEQAQAGGKKEGPANQQRDQAAGPPNAAEKPDHPAAGQPPKAGEVPQTPPVPSVSTLANLFASLAPFVKWLLYGLLAIVGIYLAVRKWAQLADILARLWSELLSLFGFKLESAAGSGDEEQAASAAQRRPFASFEDPFFSGKAHRMDPARLVIYTFEALEAWAREQVAERPPDQTPLEFAQELGRRVPALSKDVTQTAQLYVRVAYARQNPSRDSLEVLERMWRRMGLAGA